VGFKSVTPTCQRDSEVFFPSAEVEQALLN